ncbi:MAG TPA: PQQ-binding-like beta-propeller repeat protein [Longimicrobium sp.]|nr:PQQ-binding-like beta-propeller repeat protein [Longimicrobium sp.]
MMISTTPAWTFRLEKERNVFARRAAVMGGTAYVAFTYDKRDFSQSKLFALDLETGAEKWSYVVEHLASEPVTDPSGVVYWSSFEGNVYALGAGGELIWKAPGSESSIFVPCLLGDDRLVVPEVAGGARATWCLDRATGRTVWRFEHGGHAYPVHCHGDRVLHSSVISTGAGRPARCSLFCLSAADGKGVWSVTGNEYLFDPMVLRDRVFVCSSRTVRGYSAGDGELLAELSLETENSTLNLAPCSTAEMLYVWHNDPFGEEPDSVTAVEPVIQKRLFRGETLTLRERWKAGEPRGLGAAPMAFPGEWLAYLTHDGVICVVERATGASVAEIRLKSRPNKTGGLRLAGERLIAVHGRDVFCFSL